MGLPAAKLGDKMFGIDTHVVMIPSPGGPVPTPVPHPFNGQLLQSLSTDVFIDSMPAATVGSIAQNIPPHIPQGGPFQRPPQNTGKIERGSMSVTINGKAAARTLDPATTCNDVMMKMHAQVIVVQSSVFIGNGGPDPAALTMSWA